MSTAFFEDENGSNHPVAAIVRFREIFSLNPEYPGLGRYEVALADGREVRASKDDFDRALRADSEHIPAVPGSYLLTISMPKGATREDWRIFRDPILAWRIEQWGVLAPVTFDGLQECEEAVRNIQAADGRVYTSDGAQWDSLDEFQEFTFTEEECRRADAGRQSA